MQRLSYISTPLCKPLRYCSVVDVTRDRAIQRPNQEILIHKRLNGERLSITNQALELKSTSLARHLYSIGIKRNQYVAIVGPNTLEWVIGELAILKTGAVAVQLSIGATDAHDAMDIIKSTNCRYIVMDPGIDKIMKGSLLTLQKSISEWNDENQGKEIQSFLLRECEGFESFSCLENILENTLSIELPVIYSEDTAIIFSTSGSTGQPKLVQTSHIAIVHYIRDFVGDDCKLIYNDRPFGWAGGSAITSLACGFVRIFADSSYTCKKDYAEYVWNSIKGEKCTVAILMPFLISDIYDYKVRNPNDCYKLTEIRTGGELIGEVYKRALQVLCSKVLIVYGSTEVGIATTKTIKHGLALKRGDVGHCEPGVEIKIIDEDGDVTLWGSQGEICVRSKNMSQGYLNAPESNQELFVEGGWMRTGDIGQLTDEGDLIVSGKMKTVISRGTRKLLPAMIENVIRDIPEVKEVAVIPVPDKRLHEEVCVCYISDIEENKMKLLCSGLFLKSETVDGFGDAPTYFVKLQEFPFLASGKVNKKELQRIAISNLGLS